MSEVNDEFRDVYQAGEFDDQDAGQAMPPRRGNLFAFLAGLVTSALTLVGVYYCWQNDFDPMSWTWFFVIPVGALLTGLLAGSGYVVAALWLEYRPTVSFVVSVAFLQVMVYMAAMWITFEQLAIAQGAEVTLENFVIWYQFVIENVEFVTGRNKDGFRLGMLGYGFELLRIVGFSCGSLIPLLLTNRAYCEECKRYMKHTNTRYLVAAAPARKIKKGDEEGQAQLEAETVAAAEAAQAKVNELTVLLEQERHDECVGPQRALHPLEPGEEVGDLHPERGREVVQPGRRDLVDPALVLVGLLVGDADQRRELLLRQPQLRAPLADAQPDVPLDAVVARRRLSRPRPSRSRRRHGPGRPHPSRAYPATSAPPGARRS